MRSVFFSLILLASTLAAQSAASLSRLNQTLQSLAHGGAASVSLSAQLVDEMVSLAPADRQPSRGALAGFANEFTGALIGKDLTSAQVTALQRSIADLLSGSRTNFEPAGRLRETLVSIGTGGRTQSIVTRFIAVGEEIRGPDDLPVEPERLLIRK